MAYSKNSSKGKRPAAADPKPAPKDKKHVKAEKPTPKKRLAEPHALQVYIPSSSRLPRSGVSDAMV